MFSMKKNLNLSKMVSIFVVVGLLSLMIVSRTDQEAQTGTASELINGRYQRVATLDEVVSANTAAIIARRADVLVQNNVQNVADSLGDRLLLEGDDNAVTNKPSIIETDATTIEDIREYTVQESDTIASIAGRFDLSEETIRWENDIIGDTISEGLKLRIPPADGVIYVVEEGDTPASIAEYFEANKDRIISYNDAEIEGLSVGQEILVPNGTKPEPVQTYIATAPVAQPGVSSNQAVASSAFSFGGNQPVYGESNLYGFGYCTWHVADRRAEIGRPIPNNLGNAVTWATLGARAGLAVSEEPQAGAIMWHKNTYIAGGLGHVAFVEQINPDGSALISEMNYAGWNVVSNRTIPAAEFANYLFIY